MVKVPKRVVCVAAAFAVSLALPFSHAEAKSCRSVVNPYAGTRYEGVDLSRVRAQNVSCSTARRVARRAHYKALGMTPPASGVRRFRWRQWSVIGDLRGNSDRYVARARGGKRVSWRF